MNGAHLATGRYEVATPTLIQSGQKAEFTLDYSSETFFGSVTLYTNSIDNYIYLRDETEEEHENMKSMAMSMAASFSRIT